MPRRSAHAESWTELRVPPIPDGGAVRVFVTAVRFVMNSPGEHGRAGNISHRRELFRIVRCTVIDRQKLEMTLQHHVPGAALDQAGAAGDVIISLEADAETACRVVESNDPKGLPL